MKVEAPGSAVTDLHRGEVAPALMIKQGNRLVARLMAVDLYVECVHWHGHIVPAIDWRPVDDRQASGVRPRHAHGQGSPGQVLRRQGLPATTRNNAHLGRAVASRTAGLSKMIWSACSAPCRC